MTVYLLFRGVRLVETFQSEQRAMNAAVNRNQQEGVEDLWQVLPQEVRP